MKVRVTKNVLKALYDEGRYLFIEDGSVFRLKEETFVKRLSPTSKYKWFNAAGQKQYNLYSDVYGVVTVEEYKLLKYGMENGKLLSLKDFYEHKY